MPPTPAILARGPWPADRVHARWLDASFEAAPELHAQADDIIAGLEHRGSPAHDGLAARLVAYESDGEGLRLDLQPMRWSLRLVENDASGSLTALCVVRDAHGRWLAGRRAAWLASWAGRWALGAGGSVEVGENPALTLRRELEEEWSVTPASLSVEALVRLPQDLVMLVGQAWLGEGAEVVPDHEHDAHAWWPADPSRWPAEAEPPLRRLASLLAEDPAR